eukprot:15462293-Alexandrium_andersonii.AAC.1
MTTPAALSAAWTLVAPASGSSARPLTSRMRRPTRRGTGASRATRSMLGHCPRGSLRSTCWPGSGGQSRQAIGRSSMGA